MHVEQHHLLLVSLAPNAKILNWLLDLQLLFVISKSKIGVYAQTIKMSKHEEKEEKRKNSDK